MSSEPNTEQSTSAKPQCKYHDRNCVCPEDCQFLHMAIPPPKIGDEHYTDWENMMLRGLKENQRLMIKQAANHRSQVDRRLYNIEQGIKVISEKISQFSFAQGVSARPGSNLGSRPTVEPVPPTPYSEGLPDYFFNQRLDGKSSRQPRPRGRARGGPRENRSLSVNVASKATEIDWGELE